MTIDFHSPPMERSRFWGLIEKSRKALDENVVTNRAAQSETLASLLSELPVEELVRFDRRFREEYGKAMQWDLVAAVCVLLEGAISDDGFYAFVTSLMATGKKTFLGAVSDPDTALLRDAVMLRNLNYEEFGVIAGNVFEEKTGQVLMWYDDLCLNKTGTHFDINDKKQLAARAPKLWKVYGW